MKMNFGHAFHSAALVMLSPLLALSPGDCMVVGYNSSGTDAVSFVTWVELPNGESITVADADYVGGGDGSGEGVDGGAYDAISTIVWTNDSGGPIDPGTVIVITDTSNPSVNVGSVSGSFGLTNQGEHFFLVQGDFDGSDRLIGDLLFGVDYDGNGGAWGGAGEGELPGALNVANGNISFAHVDAFEFGGGRSGLPLLDYRAEIVNRVNWGLLAEGSVLSAERFIDGGAVPALPEDVLGQVNSGEIFYSHRLNNGLPIIDEAWMLGQGATLDEADNINGPSCIRIPSWVSATSRAHPTAKYYLYFGNHSGDFIRMAWAESIEGPWTGFRMSSALSLDDRGVLSLGEDGEITPGNDILVRGHIASPQVIVDEVNQQFVMYYHGATEHDGVSKGQSTVVATSADGLNFSLPSDGGQIGHGTRPVLFGESYFRVFQQAGDYYAISNTGDLWQAPDPVNLWTPPAGYDFSSRYWDKGPNPFTAAAQARGWESLRPRHFAVLQRGNILYAFLTYKEGRPERVKVATFDFDQLPADFNGWSPTFPEQELMRAASGWEGGQFPPIASEPGAENSGVNQLRDPGVLVDNDGRTYLFYCGQGEDGVGLARLVAAPQVTGSTEVVRGRNEVFTVNCDLDVIPRQRRISHSAPVEVDYDAEGVLPLSYAGSGGYALQQGHTVDAGVKSFQLAHLLSGASETLQFVDRYYARPGAELLFRNRLGASTVGQVAEVQVSFDGVEWESIHIQVGGFPESGFRDVSIDLAGLAGRVFDLRFRYEHDIYREPSFTSGAGAGQGWLIDNVVGIGLEAVQVLDEEPFSAGSFTLSEVSALMGPFLADGSGEEDRFLLTVEGEFSGADTGYGKPFVMRVRTGYEQFKLDYFSELEQSDSLISGENADPDGDGLTNLMEFVFGRDPFLIDAAVVTITGAVQNGVMEPSLTFPWQAGVDYDYQLQMGKTLNDFEDIDFTKVVTGTEVQQVVVTPASPVELIGDRVFFRLKISSQ